MIRRSSTRATISGNSAAGGWTIPLGHEVELAPAHVTRRRHRSSAGIDIGQSVSRGSSCVEIAANGKADDPCPSRNHRKRTIAIHQGAPAAGVRIVNAAMNRHRPAQADFLAISGKHCQRAHRKAEQKRRKFLMNVQPVNEAKADSFGSHRSVWHPSDVTST